MLKSVIKIAAATILFAGIHSLLATKAAKKKATKVLGERKRNGLYRTFYNAQAVITFGALVLYGISLPDRELYRIRRPLSWFTYSIQAFFLLYLLYGAKQIGFLPFSGIPNLLKLIEGKTDIPREPEGQGPALDVNGEMKATGPFRTTRHPLNFGMLPILWLMPRMSVNLATFNVVTTIYLVIGSIHEEKRLKETYGEAFTNYQESGVSFFVPTISISERKTTDIDRRLKCSFRPW
jgi:uncharacterized membrane protein